MEYQADQESLEKMETVDCQERPALGVPRVPGEQVVHLAPQAPWDHVERLALRELTELTAKMV